MPANTVNTVQYAVYAVCSCVKMYEYVSSTIEEHL